MLGNNQQLDSSDQKKWSDHPDNTLSNDEEYLKQNKINSPKIEEKNNNNSDVWTILSQINRSSKQSQDIVTLYDEIPERNTARPKRTLTPTAEWEGYVESISDHEFTAKMVYLNSNSSIPTDIATFSIDEVSEDDWQLLIKGAIFRWIIGYERLSSGQVRKVSELYFRRLPVHSEKDYKRSLNKAKNLIASIKLINETETR